MLCSKAKKEEKVPGKSDLGKVDTVQILSDCRDHWFDLNYQRKSIIAIVT